ncbi:hypothetical protein DIPPA_16091 [Diplonema papillatum]|nr:hypothetical protein DIPPA_16091 [Diplonema papillatum]
MWGRSMVRGAAPRPAYAAAMDAATDAILGAAAARAACSAAASFCAAASAACTRRSQSYGSDTETCVSGGSAAASADDPSKKYGGTNGGEGCPWVGASPWVIAMMGGTARTCRRSASAAASAAAACARGSRRADALFAAFDAGSRSFFLLRHPLALLLDGGRRLLILLRLLLPLPRPVPVRLDQLLDRPPELVVPQGKLRVRSFHRGFPLALRGVEHLQKQRVPLPHESNACSLLVRIEHAAGNRFPSNPAGLSLAGKLPPCCEGAADLVAGGGFAAADVGSRFALGLLAQRRDAPQRRDDQARPQRRFGADGCAQFVGDGGPPFRLARFGGDLPAPGGKPACGGRQPVPLLRLDGAAGASEFADDVPLSPGGLGARAQAGLRSGQPRPGRFSLGLPCPVCGQLAFDGRAQGRRRLPSKGGAGGGEGGVGVALSACNRAGRDVGAGSPGYAFAAGDRCFLAACGRAGDVVALVNPDACFSLGERLAGLLVVRDAVTGDLAVSFPGGCV